MNVDEKDAERGLYRKYHVSRADGRDEDPDDPHFGCAYFVLDLDHDPHALPALVSYARSCEERFQELADDLLDQVEARCHVWVWRVEFRDRPPLWVFAGTRDEALAVGDLRAEPPADAIDLPLEDLAAFVEEDSIYPTLMRCAIRSAEYAEGRFEGHVLADGAARDGEVPDAGAL